MGGLLCCCWCCLDNDEGRCCLDNDEGRCCLDNDEGRCCACLDNDEGWCCLQNDEVQSSRDDYGSFSSTGETRNIILFGKTGSGKATIANRILGSPVFRVTTSVGGITRSVGECTGRKKVRSGTSDITYTIKLVDTVEESSTKLRTQHISTEMQSFAESVRGGIHLVLFVFKYGRLTKEDKNAFDFIIKNYQQCISNISALVVTCCEGLDDTARKQAVTEFRTEGSTISIAEAMKKGILTVGFPNPTTLGEKLKPIYEDSMKTDAEALKDLVAHASMGVSIPPRR